MLDFSALNTDLLKSPTSPAKEEGHINIPAELKTKPVALVGPIERKKRETATEMSLLETSKLINERLRNCQQAVWTYYRAVKENRPPEEIALLSARALSLALSDQMIYTTLAMKYRLEYGIRTEEDVPYNIVRENGACSKP